MTTKTIKVDYLARVEGEGAFQIKVRDQKVIDSKFIIFEPPRFFEAFLRGRDFREAGDITARICGICPIAYQSSANHAMEDACGVTVDGPLRELRRLIYCGEWIESHALHVFMLHLPDFLGYPDVIRMAKDYPNEVKLALRLKKIGNEIVTLLGGREIHPINMAVGGFYKAPRKEDFAHLLSELQWAYEAAQQMITLTAGLKFPDFERDYEFVALRHPGEYPFNEGRLVSNKGLDIPLSEFFDHFEEIHVQHSNALQAVIKERGAYHVGPLARYNLNFDLLPSEVQKAALVAGLTEKCNNPFKSIIVRSVETLFAVHEAMRIINSYQMPANSRVEVLPRAGIGFGCSEAPRGICLHRYRIGNDGTILEARIVPPTAQNQKTMEEDLLELVPSCLNLSMEKLTHQCEQAIRNYDPCISCATHFLKIKIDYV
jgi:coenzyme F420-reducing hydrogenase alpha subunit